MDFIKNYLELKITKENAKEVYLELDGMFSSFFHMEQMDLGDYIPSETIQDFTIEKAFEQFQKQLDFETNLMERYRNTSNKYNLLKKYFDIGFTNQDFLCWNKDFINKELDQYFSKKLNISSIDLPYRERFMDTNLISLLKAFDVYTVDYDTNKRLLSAIRDFVMQGDGIIYKYSHYWLHNACLSRDETHPIYEIDQALTRDTCTSGLLFSSDALANPKSIGYYCKDVDTRNVRYRFEHLGYPDLLEEYNLILKKIEEYKGALRFKRFSDTEAVDLLGLYKVIFDKKSICCPYYLDSSYELEEKLDFKTNLHNYFLYDKDLLIGAFTYEDNFVDQNKILRDTTIKCICILPEYQDQGIGQKTFDFINHAFIRTKKIYVDIPKNNKGLLHFFVDKCKMAIDQEYILDNETIYTLVFQRELGNTQQDE